MSRERRPSPDTAGAHQVCPACAGVSPSAARFCMQCGTALSSVRAEERRNVTVLFADVSGYTALSERLDPEHVHQVIDACLRRLADEVEAHGGIVDKFIGDAIMALFGATLAHGDDPLRAVRTALAMQSSLHELNGSLGARYGIELALSIGVNTGEVVTGSVADRFTVTGDAVNVAARLQDAATAGQVLVGDRTYRATRRDIDFRSLGALALKGKAAAVPAWVALRSRAGRPRERGHGRRLVGREPEVRRLLAACDSGFAAERCTGVTVLGEAGIGKSRLLAEVAERLERDADVRVLIGSCPAYGASTGFSALAEMVRADCGVTDADARPIAAEKVRRRVDALAGSAAPPPVGPGDVMTHLLGLAGDPHGDSSGPATVRERSFATVTAWAEGLAAEHPTVLAFEDAHWAEETLGDLIEFLLGAVRRPLVLLGFARPDLVHRRPGWVRAGTSLEIGPLADDDAAGLVRDVLHDHDPALVRRVAQRSGGNPLFAEELARSVAEGRQRTVAELPDTVHGLLAARIDALPPLERRLVQEASVLGRTFDVDLLEHVAEADPATVAQAAESLQRRGILAEQSSSPQRRQLSFRHELIRDVAYNTLAIAGRARRHEKAAAAVRRCGHDPHDHVSMRADHLVRAADLAAEARLAPPETERLRALAVPSLEAAAGAAAARGAHVEAVARLEDAVRLAADPDDAARLLEALGDSALGAGRTDRAAAAWQDALDHHLQEADVVAVARLHRRLAAALAEHGDREGATAHLQAGIGAIRDRGPTLELARLYEAAAWMYAEGGQDMLAVHAAEKALSHARAIDAVGAASRTHGIFGVVLGRVGQIDRARENLERAVELSASSDPGDTIATLSLLGQHYEAVEERRAQARTHYARAHALAKAHGHVTRQVELLAALIRTDDDRSEARARAAQASELARGVPSAVAAAAALEAQAVAGVLDDRAAALVDAAKRWAAAGRPFDAARCRRSAGG